MAKLPKILDEDAQEAKAEGLQAVELWAGSFPWSKLSGDPMDNDALAAILDSFGVTPDGIKDLVEAYFDEIMTTSASALKALTKLEDMLDNLETWDFFLFIQLLDSKANIADFEAHVQDDERHLTDDDRAALSSWWELLDGVRDFMNEINAEFRALKNLVDTFQASLFRLAQDLAEHIASDLHLKEGDYDDIIDHINDMGEYRHLSIDDYYELQKYISGGGNSVYNITLPDYYLTHWYSGTLDGMYSGMSVYYIYTYNYILFDHQRTMGEIDALDLTLEEMRTYGAGSTDLIEVKVHAENNAPVILIVNGKPYKVLKQTGVNSFEEIPSGGWRKGYYYRLNYNEDKDALIVVSQALIADSSHYDDDKTVMTVAEGKRIREEYERQINLIWDVLKKNGLTEDEYEEDDR